MLRQAQHERKWGWSAAIAALLLSGSGSAAVPPPGPAEQAATEALARIARSNPRLKAVLAINPHAPAQARALDRQRMARGALFGRPILIKDNIETQDQPTTAGSLALIANDTKRDAPIVTGLRAAGAVILGKTNLSEWANIRSTASVSGWSAVGGQTVNAHDPARTPSGSSAGSGAAVAAGLVDLAIGTETDGSITGPAAVNGVVGLKPTVGLVSRTYVVPISHSQDTPGPMTRTVRDAALVLAAIAGRDPADPATAQADAHRADYAAALRPDALKGVRIGVMRFDTGLSAGTDIVFEAALAVLRAQGAVLVDIKESRFDPTIGADEHVVLMTELKADLNGYLAGAAPKVTARTLADLIAFNIANADREMPLFGQESFLEAEKTKGLDDPAYLAARDRAKRHAGPEGIDRLLHEYDVAALVGPTRNPASLIDSVNGDSSRRGPGAGSIAAVAGYPHLTVPMGDVKGLPVGLSFIGTAWSEANLLGFGAAYESARGALDPTR
ncbi:amidase [Sphingomonas sp. BIUV-7]|uniref:Amidase n=1 Tax=Sphingomonas natans TaxID=3063330 RepID=A0ABT8YDT0_9SPHN|nr:amidase [Sphingomonas sp. BIUV-7]MDO6416541.1 amidase [Sphingomonas sp. BIUV-7]